MKLLAANKLTPRQGMVCMVVCATFWSIGGVFIKLIPWSPLVITGARSLVAGAVLLLYMKLSGLKVVINRATLVNGAFLSAVFFTFVSATKYTTAANAIVLQYSSPIYILIISSLVFHQPLKRADIWVTALSLAGIALFFVDKLSLSGGGLFGDLLGLCSGVFYALLFITSNRAESPDATMSGILLGHGLCAIISLPFLLSNPPEFSPQSVGAILLLGVVQLGIPYILYGLAIQSCSSLSCVLLSMAEPLLNPVWVLLATGERPGLLALAGGLIVIASVAVWNINNTSQAVQTDRH